MYIWGCSSLFRAVVVTGIESIRVVSDHGNHGNHGNVMELKNGHGNHGKPGKIME